MGTDATSLDVSDACGLGGIEDLGKTATSRGKRGLIAVSRTSLIAAGDCRCGSFVAVASGCSMVILRDGTARTGPADGGFVCDCLSTGVDWEELRGACRVR